MIINKLWFFIALFFSIFIFFIIFLAYEDLIPKIITFIPAYDYIGHLILYGFWGLSFHKALSEKTKFGVSIGGIIIALVAVIEEILQRTSYVRTFSLIDLGFGLLGIAVFIYVYQIVLSRK